MNTPTDPDTLTAPQYRAAFEKIHDQLTDKQHGMLRAHYLAPDRKITARQLAEAVHYQKYSAVNLHYGKIGALLCELLGQEPDSERLYVLLHFIRPHTEGNDEWVWRMRKPAAQALQELGWYDHVA
jgi:hypothetical protein